MALELESEIMNEIGFGMPHNWYNGSGSCAYIRRKATKVLGRVIEKYHKEGKEIAMPNASLLETLADVAEYGDNDDFCLTKTWQAASDIIRAHMSAVLLPEANREKEYQQIKEHVQTRYLGFSNDVQNIDGYGYKSN